MLNSVDSSETPKVVQIKMGLFNITTFENGSIDYDITNNNITYALLKIFDQDVYIIAQSNFNDTMLFHAIMDRFLQLGTCFVIEINKV